MADCRLLRLAAFVLVPVMLFGSCVFLDSRNTAAEEIPKPASPKDLAFFESKIRPLLLQRCVECHSDENPESGLSLESKTGLMRGGELGKAVVPHKPKESLLISAINHDEFLKMPPKNKLSTAELALLTKWVSIGAPWPDSASTNNKERKVETEKAEATAGVQGFTEEQKSFWSFQPLRRPQLPRLTSNNFPQSPIDYFVFEKLAAKGLNPAPPASKRDLIRRATYDLIGIPPSADEIQNFLEDTSPNAFEVVVERLLASPRYGEKWGRHWLDVARFAESNGLDENIAYANAFRYRDYVIASFNGDKPYDRFVQEQIAGDLLQDEPNAQPSYDRFVGTGFLAIGAKMLAEDDPVKMQMDIIDEQLNTLCQAFMGLTIGCARCHDHKFDPISAADYYALAGIFKSTKTMENHRVVAKWFERPLAQPSEIQEIQTVDQEITRVKSDLANLQKESVARQEKELRSSIGQYLLGLVELDRFEAQAKLQNGRGLQLESGAYPVKDGYVLIEAEGFQRGNATRDTDDYGKDIGVILGSGAANLEYDLEVAKAGRYAIELRYASKERRPLRLLLDGVEVDASIASSTTSTWHPASQTWFLGGFVELTEGKHTLRFESKSPPPHVDKIAIVLQTNGEWPFGESPFSLTRWFANSQLSLPLLGVWREYLDLKTPEKASRYSARRSFFDLWLLVSDVQADFQKSALQAYAELEADTDLRRATPKVLRDALLAKRPETIEQLSKVYESTIQELLVHDEKAGTESKGNIKAGEQKTETDNIGLLREELKGKKSPLVVASKDVERYYSSEERTKSAALTSELASLEQKKPQPPMAMGTTEAQPEDLRIHLRGSHVVLGKLVSRRFPQILAGEHQSPMPDSGSGRLELARWMTNPDHPLTSRVMANRVWHWHFGRGIVSSVDNFGLLGQKPTHPELLDWLACELTESGWSVKHLHRKIMLSATYQMGTQFQPAAAEVDPENDLLWRFRRRRLTAEETRDAILSVGSGIDHTMYGSMMKFANHTYVNTTGGSGKLDYSSSRRTIYLPIIRSGVFDVLQTLDFPDPAVINGSRETTTVAPQALLMMNSDLIYEQSRKVVEEWMPPRLDDAQRISVAYQRILKRPPSLDEIIAAANYIKNLRQTLFKDLEPPSPAARNTQELEVWQSLCRVLISSNEFSYIE